MELLGLKTLVVDVITRYRSGLVDSIPKDFLLRRFGKVECLAAYRGDCGFEGALDLL